MKKYHFQPDYRNVVMAARNQQATRLPLYEHIICNEMMEKITGVNIAALMDSYEPARKV